ncbi:hypothetical protein AcV5_005626 [Taiwanofungus camphoratus]|nr:hypothetical protein AcV5_005626 [Antrodia cinnamomea]
MSMQARCSRAKARGGFGSETSALWVDRFFPSRPTSMVPAVRVAQPAPRWPLLHDAGAASRGVISASTFLAQCAILATPRLLQSSAVVCVCALVGVWLSHLCYHARSGPTCAPSLHSSAHSIRVDASHVRPLLSAQR